MSTSSEVLPPTLRGAAWASGLAWVPLIVGLAAPAVYGPRFRASVGMFATGAMMLTILFLVALAVSLVSWKRPCEHTRSVAHITATSALLGVFAAGAMFAFTMAIAPGAMP